MDNCLGDACTKIKEVKLSLRGKVSWQTLAIVASIITICIGSVVAVYGYVMQDSFSRVALKESQIVRNTIIAKENRVEIINLKRSLLTRDEFKQIVTEAIREVNTL